MPEHLPGRSAHKAKTYQSQWPEHFTACTRVDDELWYKITENREEFVVEPSSLFHGHSCALTLLFKCQCAWCSVLNHFYQKDAQVRYSPLFASPGQLYSQPAPWGNHLGPSLSGSGCGTSGPHGSCWSHAEVQVEPDLQLTTDCYMSTPFLWLWYN